MAIDALTKTKPYKGIGMEGVIARWYARNTAQGIDEFRTLARRIAAELRPRADVLEIAPGPGYLAVELAKLGSWRVTGLDVSKTFVGIARENAARAEVEVDFRLGDAAALPFAPGSFDFIVCRAAFKNFSDPLGALSEMHRVLRAGGTALIIDMRNDASNRDIADEVAKMHLGRASAFFTRAALQSLRRRAYSHGDFARMAAATPFGHCTIDEEPIGFNIRLIK